MPSVFRRVGAVLSVVTLFVGLALPPIHVHLDEDADAPDHAEGIVHSHWGAHTDLDPSVALSDGHGRVLFVDHRATASSSVRLLRPSLVALAPVNRAAALRSIPTRTHAAIATAIRDGPPRRLSAARAPPLVA